MGASQRVCVAGGDFAARELIALSALLCAISIVLGLQVIMLAINLAYWYGRKLPEADPVRISVLIPARNEIRNLPTLLSMLSEQSHAALEILVCDDGSTDGTTEWLAAHAQEHGVEWFAGAERPEEWTGKNWACAQLAERAHGEWLLFMDADLRPSPAFLGRFAGWCGAKEAVLVTALPRVRPSGLGDGLLIGMVSWSVFTLLPLALAERHPNPAFGFANGQMMGFARDTYRQLAPHSRLRSSLLEDVEIARLVKREGGQVLIGDATDVAAVEMYSGLRDAFDGFSKNSVAICGGRLRAVVCAALTAVVHLLPLALGIAGFWPAWALAGTSMALYGISVSVLRLPLWYSVCCPVAVVLAVGVMLRSVAWHSAGRIAWKGRVYGEP